MRDSRQTAGRTTAVISGSSLLQEGGSMTSRRDFVAGLGALALPLDPLARALGPGLRTEAFSLSVLTDEISQDLGHACEIVAREFGLGYVELRSAHDKNIMSWDTNDVAE